MNNILKKRLSKIQLDQNVSIDSGIKNLIKSGEQIILIINKKRQLVGTVTDGDLRNFVIKNTSILKLPLKRVMNKNPIFLKKSELPKKNLMRFMIQNKISQLPIIDKNKKLINFFSIKDFFKFENIVNTFVIMAGGYGKRLLPYTKNTPKPLLKIDDKPIIIHMIEKAKKMGFKNFVISTGYLKNKIIKFLKNGKALDIKISYIKEKEPLGTAGSLAYLRKQYKSLVVCNGDIMSNIDFRDFLKKHEQSKAYMSIASKRHNIQNPFGVLITKDSKVIKIEEKPTYNSLINIGAYVISPLALKLIDKGKPFSMVDLINKVIKNKKKVSHYIINEPWYDIGTPEDLKKFNQN